MRVLFTRVGVIALSCSWYCAVSAAQSAQSVLAGIYDRQRNTRKTKEKCAGAAHRCGLAVRNRRSARVGDEIGGHHVSGHVHTTAALAALHLAPDNRRLAFRVPPQWTKYILPKGFIAINGCSLTVRA